MRTSHLLHRHIASQRNAVVMQSPRWSTTGLISTTSMYKERMSTQPNTTFLVFFIPKSPKNSSNGAFTTQITVLHLALHPPHRDGHTSLGGAGASHVVVVGRVAAARLRVVVLDRGVESAAFPGSKLEVTDQAIFQNTIFPQTILLQLFTNNLEFSHFILS